MARASGWYKRRAQLISLVIAVALSALTNADSIHFATALWEDAALRQVVVANAQAWVAAQTAAGAPATAVPVTSAPPALTVPQPAASVGAATTASPASPATPREEANRLQAKLVTDLSTLKEFPIGWNDSTGKVGLMTVVGWLLTAIAVSLGSGFWFDLLSRALQLRGTGPKVSATTGETSDS